MSLTQGSLKNVIEAINAGAPIVLARNKGVRVAALHRRQGAAPDSSVPDGFRSDAPVRGRHAKPAGDDWWQE